MRIELLPTTQAAEIGATMGLPSERTGLSVFRTLAHYPDLAKAIYGLVDVMFGRCLIGVRLRELIIMRIAWVTRSNYEWAQHWRIASRADIPPEDLLAVRDWRQSKRLNDLDRVVLSAVDDTLGDGRISDDVWNNCVLLLREPEKLVELVIIIGNWTMFSQLLRSFDVPLEEGSQPWPPDGVAPASSNATRPAE